jgi:chorismate dehydratase
MKLRLGHLSYLNAIPIYHPLMKSIVPFSASLVSGVPADLNRALHQGEVDLSLISSYEFLRHNEQYTLLPGLCIAAHRKVMSVTLYVKEGISLSELNGQMIALTPQSASSAQLVKILCKHHWRITPDFTILSSLEDCSQYPAFLLIGDQALHCPTFDGYITIDLAEAWDELTHLPMTFAVFAARKEVMETRGDEIMSLQQQMLQALAWSQENLSTITSVAAQQSGLSKEILHRYYTLIHHRLGTGEMNGLRRYAALCNVDLATVSMVSCA